MEPARINYYGLIRMTKSGYLIATLVAALIVAGLLLVLYPAGYLPPFRWPWQPVPRPDADGLGGMVYNHLYDIITVCLLAEMVDIVVTLRAFARKEAELRESDPKHDSTSPH
jgi:hypothetical protein